MSTKEIMRDATLSVSVKASRQFRPRIWLGSFFLRLAAKIMQCNIEVNIK